MKKLTIIVSLCFALIYGQNKPDFISQPLQCSTCHTCEVPTKNNPCLRQCIREHLITVEHNASEAPSVITIDRFRELENHYMPVHFTHKLHAEMSNISGGCQTCHHYNPPGRIQTCIECHETNRKREDISKPDLKAAYHRQCMDCHLKWSHEYECESCHLENGHQRSIDKDKSKTMKTAHPKIEEPTKLVYNTECGEGNVVTFFHNEHVNLYNLDCRKCHSDYSCIKCHDKAKDKIASSAKDIDLHDKCSQCHNIDDNCNFCHSSKEKSGFDHLARTAWELKKPHNTLECLDCHRSKGNFTGLRSDCGSCHDSWTRENFNHSITGLTLDENHIENECEDCHVGLDYKNPTCENCHDEDIKYPANLPGKRFK